MIRQFVIKNYLGSSPRGVQDEFKMEAGFDLEHFVWNPYYGFQGMCRPHFGTINMGIGTFAKLRVDRRVARGCRLTQSPIVRHVHSI
jgi:hypothetical protein